MKLTLQTDIALRILMTLAVEPERVRSVEEISEHFKLSKHHVMKLPSNWQSWDILQQSEVAQEASGLPAPVQTYG